MFLILFLSGFIAKLIDSALGMMYGTLLVPILIGSKFDPLVVIPSVLLSQGVGNLTASIFHHKFNNASLTPYHINPKLIFTKLKTHGFLHCIKSNLSRELKIVIINTFLGIFTVSLAAIIATHIPIKILKNYITLIVTLMGFLLLSKLQFKFSWKKIFLVSIISGFNKGLTGGGFGPLLTAGQIVGGQHTHKSVATTNLSSAIVCIIGFFSYYFINGFSQWGFLLSLTGGAVLGGPLGAMLASKIKIKKLRLIMGVVCVGLGVWTIISH